MSNPHFTYVLASKPRGAMFVGVSDDLVNRVLDHKCNLVEGITCRYAINQLVYYERHANHGAALEREQEIRNMHRIWKRELIEQHNPAWRDLYDDLVKAGAAPAA